MKDYRDLEKEYYNNKKKIRKIFYSFKFLRAGGIEEYNYLKSRNERIKTIFEDNGVKL